MRLSKNQLAVVALITANMIWGAAPPIFKWALHDIHPFTLAFLRFFIPALILLPFCWKKLHLKPNVFFKMIIINLFGITINIIFFFQGLLRAPSINAALIGSSAPVFIILFSLFFLKEKPRKKLITGSLIGLLGVMLVLGAPLILDGKLAVVGNLFYLFAMFGSVIAILILRGVAKKNDPVTLTFWSFLMGSTGFVPFFANEVHHYGFLPHLTYQGLTGLLFGIFFSSLTAYFLQTWAIKYLTAADVSVFTYIDPVVTILIAAPLLGEFPDFIFVVGSVMVVLGILMAEGRFHWHPLHLFLKK
jgi:drug/metabolite transporter (DMT)-like permease